MYTKDELGYKRKGKKKSKRPMELSIVCGLVVLYGMLNLILMYTPQYIETNAIYPAVNALVIVFSFVSISGIWSMEKWGPITFPFVVLLKIVMDFIILGKFNPWYLTGFIIAAFFFRFYHKMKHSE